MKVMTIQGSPKTAGNTAAVLAALEEELVTRGHEIDRVDVASSEILGCLGCFACQQAPTDELGCVQRDDLEAIFTRLVIADAILFATPLYAWGFPAQLKALIDRCGQLVKGIGSPHPRSRVEGKRLALLVTCGGPVENNADLIQIAFDRMSGMLLGRTVGKCVIPFCTAPAALGANALAAAQKLAGEIVA